MLKNRILCHENISFNSYSKAVPTAVSCLIPCKSEKSGAGGVIVCQLDPGGGEGDHLPIIC